jgi:hypothetical protein
MFEGEWIFEIPDEVRRKLRWTTVRNRAEWRQTVRRILEGEKYSAEDMQEPHTKIYCKRYVFYPTQLIYFQIVPRSHIVLPKELIQAIEAIEKGEKDVVIPRLRDIKYRYTYSQFYLGFTRVFEEPAKVFKYGIDAPFVPRILYIEREGGYVDTLIHFTDGSYQGEFDEIWIPLVEAGWDMIVRRDE